MASRLVLGCGAAGETIVAAIADLPGELRVVDPDEDRVERLRDDGVSATAAPPDDADYLGTLVGEYDVVIVAADDPALNVTTAKVARVQFPTARLIALADERASRDERETLRATSDRLIDATEELAGRLLSQLTTPAAQRTQELQGVLRGLEGDLGIIMHDNPDPDAIGAAVALQHLAQSVGVTSVACYYGEIAHQENRALVNLLELELRQIMVGQDLSVFGALALVDHSRPGVNDQLDPDSSVDIIIDHHPPRAPVEGRYLDLRQEVGATSTMLVQYLDGLDLEIPTEIATALLYGIRTDTDDFTSHVTEADFAAASSLLPRADTSILERVENPSFSRETLDAIARAIQSRRQQGAVLVSWVGALSNRDVLAQAADQLLEMEGIEAVLTYGHMDETVYASARARGTDLDIGETLRNAFGRIGSAGGHAEMAGAQIPMGMLGEGGDDDSDRIEVVRESLAERFFETVSRQPESVITRYGFDRFPYPMDTGEE